MNNASKLLKNTLLLAASTVIMRLCALCFQSYLAEQAGAEQLGIFGIISSVGVVFATVAISGVRFSVTRLVAEDCSRGNRYPHSLMRCAYFYAAFFGGISGLVMYGGADALSHYWVMNSAAKDALRIMALSMPLIAFGSVAQGYFTAKQKILRLVLTEFISQLLRIVYVAFCFNFGRITSVTDVLAQGMFVSEASLSLGMTVLYIMESSGEKEVNPKKRNLPALIKTALPLAVSAYMRTGLSSLGQIIIPHGLRRSGMGSASAFSTYGVISQMSMPVIMFPAALLGALGEILVPRLTQAQVEGRKIGISYIVNRALRIGVIFSFGVAGAMLFFAQMLGRTVYNSVEAGLYIGIFAPLVPIIYIDCVTDGCLKGLNQQVHSMIYNVMEGVLNVVLLFILLPRTAIMGYIIVMYIKEIFNAVLSIHRLSKVTTIDFKSWGIVATLLSAWGAQIFCKIVLPGGKIVPVIMLYCLFYVTLLYVINAVSRDDIRWVASLFKTGTGSDKNIIKKPFAGVDKTVLER